jgi:chromosome segregation ATPase
LKQLEGKCSSLKKQNHYFADQNKYLKKRCEEFETSFHDKSRELNEYEEKILDLNRELDNYKSISDLNEKNMNEMIQKQKSIHFKFKAKFTSLTKSKHYYEKKSVQNVSFE